MENPLGKFLQKFKDLRPPHDSVRRAVSQSIKKHTHLDVAVSDIDVRGDTVFLCVHPAVRTTIALQERAIIDDVTKRLGGRAPFRAIR